MMLAAVRRSGLSASRRAQGLADAGQVCSYMGRNAEALTYLQESVDIARALGEHDRVAWALQPMGMAAIGLGDRALAQRCLSEAVVLARRLGGPFELAAALNALAQLERLEGRRDAARQLYEETLALARGAHLWEIVAVALLNLAMLGTQDELAPDGPGAVAACIAEAMLLSRDIGSKPLLLGVLDAATGLAGRLGDGAAAAVWHGAARRLLRETGLQRDAADEAFLTPLLPLARASVPAEAWRAAEAQGEGDALASTTERLAAWLGQRQSARS